MWVQNLWNWEYEDEVVLFCFFFFLTKMRMVFKEVKLRMMLGVSPQEFEVAKNDVSSSGEGDTADCK